jgi:hypothetical protein
MKLGKKQLPLHVGQSNPRAFKMVAPSEGDSLKHPKGLSAKLGVWRKGLPSIISRLFFHLRSLYFM